MKWFLLFLILQFTMWGASEESPGTTEGEASETMAHAKEKCEQNKSQLESLKEIMLKNKQSLKKKEEEVQEYARRLSKIKSRAKLSRRSRERNLTSTDVTHTSETSLADTSEGSIDDISQAKTAKAKSTLLQKKLAENRKAFEQRNKEIIETKRAVEEKVEAIRQQLEEKDVAVVGFQKEQLSSIAPVKPVMITSDVMSLIQIESIQEKENKIAELTNKILELEATIIDLQENLKEKDSVIESKTKAVTLMSADLSKKGKTTLDILEDTKDEMRTMQEHFVLLETSLKNKNENLLIQLQERDNKITELENSVDGFKKEINKQKLSESASADFSRSTMDALVETKEAMKSMQENFVLMESSLKAKNENLLQQLKDYELKLAEANERVFKLESGIGIVRDPTVDDLQFKLQKLEHNNKQLQDEKYELQKGVAELQDKIVNISMHGNGAIMEKDNRIVELENLVEELKQSNKLLEEESKAELQNQVADLTSKNEEYSNKITDLENLVHKLEEQKNEIMAKLPEESTIKEGEKVMKLTKELEELNKGMIKIKAQHKSKVKSLQKQLENFKKVSDTNAELVRLGNQVALLEEEKGNLQLSLVDFDELKASAGDWQERVVDLESKVSAQTKEIEMQIEAIAILENQKLDLMQELHMAKREISSLEAENAESENLRVTAEMKVVDLEEQLEAMHRLQNESKLESSMEANHTELIKQVATLTQENAELYNRISKLEEKGTSDTGSTESFETVQELDKTDLLKKVEDLTQKNSNLTLKLNKLQEKENFHAESTESINDPDKNELLKKIDQLTQENTDLTMKLSRVEEKGSSDTGSTESFERIPEHNESITKIELLTQENSELVIKLTKLEEQLEHVESKSNVDLKLKVDTLLQENDNKSVELSNLRVQITNLIEENSKLQKQIEVLSTIVKLDDDSQIETKLSEASEISIREIDFKAQVDILMEEKSLLQKEVKELRNSLDQWHETTQDLQINDLRTKIEELLKENEEVVTKVSELKSFNQKLKDNLTEVMLEKEKLHLKMNQMLQDDPDNEKLELIEKLEKLNQEKQDAVQDSTGLQKSGQEVFETPQSDDALSQQTEFMIVASLEHEIEKCKSLITEQTGLIEEMKIKLANKEEELEEKGKQIMECEKSGKKVEILENELKEMFDTLEEWKYKCNEMQEKMEKLEAGKASIEEGFKILQNEYKILLDEKEKKDAEIISLQQQLHSTTTTFELKHQEQIAAISEKDNEIANFKAIVEDKNQELQAKNAELQNKMIMIDSLQDELNNYKMLIQDKDSLLTSISNEVANLSNLVKSKEEEVHSLRKDIVELNNKVKESKPMKDYDALVEQLKDKDMILDELECNINATTKENSNLLEKVKNLSQQNYDIQNQLVEKQREFVDLITMKDHLEVQIVEAKNEKGEAERQVWELQSIIDNNTGFVNDVQAELRSAYKQIEQLKVKHTEDTQMQNQRLENVIEELNAKMQECEILKGELEEKERLVGHNITEETKLALEAKVADLEQKLKDSDDKIQMQLEKMKKIAANLKKKTAVCQELESRVTELEEKWTTEKDEKEAKNKQIQDVEIAIREKDNRIADLEEKLIQARNESTEASKNIERLTNDLTNSKEKMPLLMQQLTEMEEEIVKLRKDIESSTAELATERESKQNIISEYESYKQQVIQENERKQLELEDIKEKARELSVRMQVMEAEYVDQLALINDLKAQNGLLLSKQAHINEKLEIVEKESEERRLLIEQMEKAVINTSTETTQTLEEEVTEDDTKMTGVQHCSHCEQCQTLVQALEAKLQEREAEIENLDNELANSIGNFVQMRESLRFNDLMNQTSMRNRSLEDPYNDLLFQYNSLIANHEEVKAKLEETLRENKELIGKVEEQQSRNATLEEKIVRTEQILEDNKQNIERLEGADLLNSDLTKECKIRETELLNMQQKMQIVQKRTDELEQQLSFQIDSLKSMEAQREMAEKLLQDTRHSLEQEIESLKVNKESSEKKIEELKMELDAYRNLNTESIEKSKKESPVLDSTPQNNAPQLFDASKIFGMSSASNSDLLINKEVRRLQTLLNEKEAQCSNLTQEINHLQKLMIEERTQISQNYSQRVEELEASQKQLHAAEANVEKLKEVLTEKENQIDSLNAELHNLSTQMMEQQNDIENKFKDSLLAKDNQIEKLNMTLISTKEELNKTVEDKNQQKVLLDSCKLQINNLEAELKNSTDLELITELENRVSILTKERDLLQLQVNDLSRSMKELKDSMNVERHLQMKIEKIMHEGDEATEPVVNLTQALEEVYKQSDKTPTIMDMSKESTPLEEITVGQQTEPKTTKVTTEEIQQEVSLDVEAAWDAGSMEKLDEETWGWNVDDAQLIDEQHLTTTLIPSKEMQLQAKIDDLQDQIKDLEKEKEKMTEESKATQLRNAKLIKKLKEYKVQLESLQQQIKIQKSASDFYELDSAIEEELKSQISKLEKTLVELKEEQKNTVAEKEALIKRLDVVVSANERYMEMKERQDMDMEVLRIQNKELSDKVEVLDKRLQESAVKLDGNDISKNENISLNEESKPVIQERSREKRSVQEADYENLCKTYKDEIDDLKDEMEALATENEQLQHFLEELKMKLSALESKRTAEENESIQIVDDLNKRISELQGMLSKSREEYDLLRKQYEQSLMDANDQVTAMRQNTDFLKEEAFEKTSKLEMEIADLRQQIEISESNAIELQKRLQDVLQEKASAEEKLTALMTSSEKQLSSMNASMVEVIDLLNIRIQEVADLKQELQKQYTDNEGAKLKLQDTIQGLNQELNEKKQQLEILKKSLSDKENECIQQQSMETVSATVSQATQELVQKHAIEIEEKEKQIQNLNERLSTLEKVISEHSLEKQSNISQFRILQQELELLKQNLMEKESNLESIQVNLISITDQLTEKQLELSESKARVQKLSLDNQRYTETIEELNKRLNESEAASVSVNEYILRIQTLEQEVQSTTLTLMEKESILQHHIQETTEQKIVLDNNKIEIDKLRTEVQNVEDLKNELLRKTEQIDILNLELEATRKTLEETHHSLNEKVSLLEKSSQTLNEKQMEIDRLLTTVQQSQHQPSSSNTIDGLPVFKMGNNEQNLQRTIDNMQVELERKEEEIEHLKYILNENTYPSIIQEMQQRINCLYNEKAELESALEVATIRAEDKEKQIDALKQRIEIQNQEFVSKEEASLHSKDRRSVQDQEQIVRLQNELYAKEQEINELKYVIAEKDSQLSLQASMEPQSDEFELREMVQRLTTELYGKEQEIQHLKSTIVGLQKEASRLQEFERLSETTKEAIQKLSIEKEQVRLEAHEFLEKKLREKEMEIDEIKQRLVKENQNILNELRLRDTDIENLKKQLKEFSTIEQTMKNELHQKDEELIRVSSDLAEKERRLAELSITKDAELHNLKIQIHEKEERIEEVLASYDEARKQLTELKNTLAARETEINSLKTLLEEKVKEYELIRNVLTKDVPATDTSAVRSVEASDEENKASTSQELDLALYMLHQRDVRCEELTHELMQLLEERDTLQLRLSNAIRVNEELRKMGSSASSDLSPKKEASSSSTVEPIVEHPSPSKSEGPVEIAKEAIDTPIGEDKETLALKLSQLQTVSHAKDVRLRDERELRHTQQMSLLAHKDVLSTLPPEAAARLVNANYTLSRDVQSQSSVLLNWLWGKSTPKVVHM
ncbi:golgin subfamily B member 1-like isoform X1 [Bombus pascuorum]|uniref:golgin subfamily B member 1-like isoform X1 n=2 Tax=Bombus pascuorum TaxID=65598 RepID=UPI00298EBBE9|nr:golgin subfamily B member 1-like isoform X1 [Bombus pascuorum]